MAELRREHDERKEMIGVVCGEGVSRDLMERKLTAIIDLLDKDTGFLSEGLQTADANYRNKYNCPNTSKTVLMELCWERVECSTLLQQSQVLKAFFESFLPFLNPVQEVARQVSEKREDFLKYLRNIFVKKRQPGATHVFVFLVSQEERNRKPYCLPVQYIPYHSLKDQYVWDLSGKIKTQMIAMGMKPIGKNYIRTYLLLFKIALRFLYFPLHKLC